MKKINSFELELGTDTPELTVQLFYSADLENSQSYIDSSSRREKVYEAFLSKDCAKRIASDLQKSLENQDDSDMIVLHICADYTKTQDVVLDRKIGVELLKSIQMYL